MNARAWHDVGSAEQFEALKAFAKGYVVHLYGRRTDYPHVPEQWEPGNSTEQALYDDGRFEAMMDVAYANFS